MMGWLENTELENIWKVAVLPNLKWAAITEYAVGRAGGTGKNTINIVLQAKAKQ
jgi:hypothetical protein